MLMIKISDNKADSLLRDFVGYKLFVAKSLVIKNNIFVKSPNPYERYKTFELETNISNFLFWAVGVIDAIQKEIEKKENLVIKFDPKITPIVRKPRRMNAKQNKIWQIFESFFRSPTFDMKIMTNTEYVKRLTMPFPSASLTVDNFNDISEAHRRLSKFGITGQLSKIRSYPCHVGFDPVLNDSYLWILKKLRNHITHENILKRIDIMGLTDITTIYFLIDDRKGMNPENMIEILYPYQFFSKSVSVLEGFVNSIRSQF